MTYDDHRRPCRRLGYVKRFRAARRRGEPWSVDASPYRDRLRALASAGWTAKALGEVMGRDENEIRSLWCGRRTSMYTSTADQILALYERLKDQPPTSNKPRTARTWARKQGWPTVDDIEYGHIKIDQTVDDVVVRRALETGSRELSREERLEVVRRLHERGLGQKRIAEWFGVEKTQAFRWLDQLGLVQHQEQLA